MLNIWAHLIQQDPEVFRSFHTDRRAHLHNRSEDKHRGHIYLRENARSEGNIIVQSYFLLYTHCYQDP